MDATLEATRTFWWEELDEEELRAYYMSAAEEFEYETFGYTSEARYRSIRMEVPE